MFPVMVSNGSEVLESGVSVFSNFRGIYYPNVNLRTPFYEIVYTNGDAFWKTTAYKL